MQTAFVLASVVAAALALAPGHALGWSSHGGPGPSVFPRPVDPWRSWGAQPFHHHRGFHHHGGFHHHPGFHSGFSIVVPSRRHLHGSPVWVPGQWVWNGFAWLWVPGHWVR